MNSSGGSLVILLALTAAMSQPSSCFGQQDVAQPEVSDETRAGFPIAATRRRAINARPFHRPLDAATIKKWMELSSRCTIAEFELFLAPLTPQEEELLRVIKRTPAPIINRLHFQHLRSVLSSGGIVALELEEEVRNAQLPHTTPAVENELFGADDCVFASVGPPHGSPRYGDVIIRLKDSVREKGWATPFSGMHFLSAIRGQDVKGMLDRLLIGESLPTSGDSRLSLGFDDRLHYSHYIVTEREWNQALAYQAILVLRNVDDSDAGQRIRERADALLDETDAVKFWTLFIPPRKQDLSPAEEADRLPLGYLEAKFPGELPIEYFTSIEVPQDRLADVRAWPEAKPYLHLIGAVPSDVD